MQDVRMWFLTTSLTAAPMKYTMYNVQYMMHNI